jgi:hypothetical protein
MRTYVEMELLPEKSDLRTLSSNIEMLKQAVVL